MPLVMKGGKLVIVPALKSDKPVPQTAINTIKPETVAEIKDQNVEAAASEVPTSLEIDETPSIHQGKTKAELKVLLEENKIEFPKSAKHADLVELADTIEDESEEI